MNPPISLKDGRLVLSDQGLARLDAHGDVVWRIGTDPGDPFVEVRLDGGEALANTWNGVQVRLCLETGQILDRRPVK